MDKARQAFVGEFPLETVGRRQPSLVGLHVLIRDARTGYVTHMLREHALYLTRGDA